MAGLTPEQQWIKELKRILNARAVETEGERLGNDEVQKRSDEYRQAAAAFADVQGEALAAARDRIQAIDRERFEQRVAEWRAEYLVYVNQDAFSDSLLNKTRLEAKNGLKQQLAGLRAHLVAAATPAEVETQMKACEALRVKLDTRGDAGQAPVRPAVPAQRALALEEAAAALAELDADDPLLFKEIARNDTWGDFDLTASLDTDSPDFERQSKVLLNILERYLAARQEAEEWAGYTRQIGGLAAAANAVQPQPQPQGQGFDRSRGIAADETADPKQVYKLAILGAGASAAYYIANSAIDLSTTLLIGEKQPWDGERGADGQVNHPHPLIDPEDQHRIDAEEGLAKRRAFSERLKKIIDRVPHQCDGRVTSVEKNLAGDQVYWKIETSRGTYFAQRVQSSLGAGEHTAQADGSDMDTYKRSIETVPAEERDREFTIAISGGSAAIDVVTDVLRKYSSAKIHWAPGNSGAQFIPGTDNDISAIPYFEGLKKSRDAAVRKNAPASELEKLDDEIKRMQVSIDAAKQLVGDWQAMADRVTLYPGRGTITANADADAADKPYVLAAGGQRIKVNKAVYAVGQDNEAVSAMFKDNTGGDQAARLDVAPTADPSGHFTVAPIEADPRKIREHIGMPKVGMAPWGENGASIDLLADPPLTPKALAALGRKDLPLGAQSTDGSLQFIGAQGFRELEAQAKRPDAEATLKAQAGEAVTAMTQGVPTTLGPNVVNNAQLTSARERIAASENAMPFSSEDILLVAEKDGVSFLTANQTVLATHIAVLYPNIDPGLADYLVAQIIVDRAGENGPVPQRRENQGADEPEHHLRALQAFHAKWRKRLQHFDQQMTPPAEVDTLLSRYEEERDEADKAARTKPEPIKAVIDKTTMEMEDLLSELQAAADGSGPMSTRTRKRVAQAAKWVDQRISDLAKQREKAVH